MPPPPETFHKIKYVSDPYKPRIAVVTHGDSRKGVRQMNGAKGIKSQFQRLFEGEAPVIPKGGAKQKSMSASRFLTSDGFKYSSPTKESNNRGDYTATFTKKIDHIPITVPESEGNVEARKSRTKKLPNAMPSRNVTTSPYREEVFNKIPYITPSVDKVPKRKKNSERVAPFSFTKKNELFKKTDYIPEGIMKSKSYSAIEAIKDSTIIDCGSFRPSSPIINTTAAVAGTFSPVKYEGSRYDDHVRRKATVPDRLHPLPPKIKDWVS